VIWSSAPDPEPPFGFNALPGGWTLDSLNSGVFPTEAEFWSASVDDEIPAKITPAQFSTYPVREGVGASVRCLED
jgi:hypothetical protein